LNNTKDLQYKKPFFVFRGLKDIDLCQKINSGYFRYLDNRHYLSTSYDKTIADTFARTNGMGGCTYKIHIFPEENLSFLFISPANNTRQEHEILFEKGIYLVPLNNNNPFEVRATKIKPHYPKVNKDIKLDKIKINFNTMIADHELLQIINEERDFYDNDEDLINGVLSELEELPSFKSILSESREKQIYIEKLKQKINRLL